MNIIVIISLLMSSFGTMPSQPTYIASPTVVLTDTVFIDNSPYSIPKVLDIKGRISSGYGYRHHPLHNCRKLHTGIDYPMVEGTDILSIGNGRIYKIEYKRTGYGKNVTVSHGMNHNGDHVTVRYCHLNKIQCKVGDMVLEGDVIALSGNTGSSTGPHLHFELRINGEPENPSHYMEVTQYMHKYID